MSSPVFPSAESRAPSTRAASIGTAEREAERTAVATPMPAQEAAPGGIKFWLIMISLMVTTFLSALDLTAVSTALPVIVQELHGTDFVWVGAAFSLGSTAFLPLSGGLAQSFGRRPVILGSIAFFAIGSAVSGSAKTMNALIIGRTIQGVGGGGILSLTEIIIADMVPLRLRGPYMGLIGAVWAVASAIGPPIGGVLAEHNWRWLFYLNLPLTAVAMALVVFFLDLKVPQDDLYSKMKRMDWIGNILVVGSTTGMVIALAWAGVQYSWASYQTLVPLIIGLVGLTVFMVYEAKFATEPVVPWQLVNNRTGASGYITVFLHGIASTAAVFYLPVYFQGVQLHKPIASGISLFGIAFTIAPAAIACGIMVAKFNNYKPENFAGWAFTTIGFGIISMLTVSSPKGWQIGFQIILGIGLGILYAGPTFPVLAPLPVTETAHALALFAFVRNFAQTFGVTVGSTILQNQLQKKLPDTFLAQFSAHGAEIAYSVIPVIPSLEEPLKGQVRTAFAESLQLIWQVMIAVSGLGLLCVLAMKEIRMHEVTDQDWGMAERKPSEDAEKA